MKTLVVEYNAEFVRGKDSLANGKILITPPIDEDYWLIRVCVSKKQSVVAFPKLGTIGIGFQIEDDWNTNLPFNCDTREIFNHIKHNKGDKNVPDNVCIEAIKLLQDEIVNQKLIQKVYGVK